MNDWIYKQHRKDYCENIDGRLGFGQYDEYHGDMALLGIGKPDKEPRATEYIKEMIKFIALLIKNGRAYEADGDVYFDIKKFKNY